MRLKNGINIEEGPDGIILGSDNKDISEYDILIPLSEEAAFLIKNLGTEEFDEDLLASMLCNKFGMDFTIALDEALSLMNHWEEMGIVKW